MLLEEPSMYSEINKSEAEPPEVFPALVVMFTAELEADKLNQQAS